MLMNRIKRLFRRSSQQLPRLPYPITPVKGQETLGTVYGGWTVPIHSFNENSICYCFGAGEDISFDIELIKRFGCHIYTFDPTPHSQRHIKQLIENTRQEKKTFVNNDPDLAYDIAPVDLNKLHVYDFGIWNENAVVTFYAPQNPDHVSHSIVNLQNTTGGFEAQCYTLQHIMDMLGHDALTCMKLDIEGAEYAVLDSMMNAGIKPQILCVEFDEGHNPQDKDYIRRIHGTLGNLVESGYRITHRSGWDFTLVDRAQMGNP